jgi:hypothetical protein
MTFVNYIPVIDSFYLPGKQWRGHAIVNYPGRHTLNFYSLNRLSRPLHHCSAPRFLYQTGFLEGPATLIPG